MLYEDVHTCGRSPPQPMQIECCIDNNNNKGFIYERCEFTREEATLDQGPSDGERTGLRLPLSCLPTGERLTTQSR